MSSRETMDELLRRTLKSYPAPICTATLTDDIVRGVKRHESFQRQSSRRALLIAYWIVVAISSWWIVRSLPLPAWMPESLSPALAWLIPFAGALLIWLGPIARWLASACRRLFSAPLTSTCSYQE